ncbi:hypothetical protein KDX27_37580 [Burkholderia cenocepacia]|uniref:hypothetical protein n=1 Tax=Burkholderia TaxID=32008 RepID=UPI000F59811B|nr:MULTISPECIES: hypothetical protein [Burkholderia]MBR8030306.1 hypothetical protein [Burkholderia cenocepacia]MBR8173403.1 hypothetical protein [Burkholderia cenocepacia]RQR65252.1 hypothetical protein DIE12_32000 [Burkholderia sp. Bp9015]
MKQKAASTMTAAPTWSSKPAMVMVVAMGVMLISIGALNGGTALTGSAWDAIQTTIKEMLASTYVMFAILLVLLVTIWQLAHGQGYRNLAVVLGILATALIGPSIVQTVATANGPAPTSSNTATDFGLAH